MSNFEITIGIEVHTALSTKTKMFSLSITSHKLEQNKAISPIDFALPGTLPTLNKAAVKKGLVLAKALNMKTNHHNIAFERKHYYYIDLPKGYQITQFNSPIGFNGYIEINKNDTLKKIRIKQIHLEEDTAKQTTIDNKVYLDYNRAGWPLIEIVTEADMNCADDVVLFLEELRKILLLNNISDAKMEDGSLRVDVNISIRPYGQKEYGTKVEIKNINSISNVAKAINYEVKRQRSLLVLNQEVEQQTRRYDDSSQTTVYMRSKQQAVNYRYINEPNIAPIRLDDSYVEDILKQEYQDINLFRKSFIDQGLNASAIEQLLGDGDLYKVFANVNKKVNNPSSVYKWVCLEFLGLINKQNIALVDVNQSMWDNIAEMIILFDKTLINGKQTKTILEHILKTNKDPKVLIKELGFEQITDQKVLTDILLSIINDNKQMIEEQKDRIERVEKFIMGELMKRTKAQANPSISFEILKTLLK